MDFQNDTLAVIPNHQGKNLPVTVKSVLDPGRRQGVPVVYIAVPFRSADADAPAHPPLSQGVKREGVHQSRHAGGGNL
jgi:hypothetical protein